MSNMYLPPVIEAMVADEPEMIRDLVEGLLLSTEPAESVIRKLQDTFGGTVSASTIRTWRRSYAREGTEYRREGGATLGEGVQAAPDDPTRGAGAGEV